ncbi:DUF6538 domain-containing protein [Ensifer adhaerens]|uniref:DUF6538 domain-containing protein n=1 Tax=Ensifer adhaerens TaxID=106592 RepID=UPI00132E8EC6|nr:DUF6538 domain-containing protein [Ensifer adhaerens]QHG70112.1 hypothetical protein DQW09_09720 [Ensifer adhaerens]
MPAPSSADTRYLEVHGSKWRVVFNVPRQLQGKLGTKLKRSLGTDSLSEANRLKWDVVAEFRATIDQARRPNVSKEAALASARVKAMEEARRLSQQRVVAFGTEQRGRVDDAIEDYAEAENVLLFHAFNQDNRDTLEDRFVRNPIEPLWGELAGYSFRVGGQIKCL